MSEVGLSRVVAVIPARRGSKRLPLKNLRPLAGWPLVVHSIRAAQRASLVTTVVVSTEDREIADLARAHGAKVIERPPELATDTTQNNEVVRHVVAAHPHDVIALLQPTSPLRRSSDIDACIAPVLAGQVVSAMTVTEVDHHPGKAVVLDDGLVVPFTNDADMEARRQDMREVYRQNGAVYAISTEAFLRYNKFYVQPCQAILMPADLSIDIDREIDLQLAEIIIASRKTDDA